MLKETLAASFMRDLDFARYLPKQVWENFGILTYGPETWRVGTLKMKISSKLLSSLTSFSFGNPGLEKSSVSYCYGEKLVDI